MDSAKTKNEGLAWAAMNLAKVARARGALVPLGLAVLGLLLSGLALALLPGASAKILEDPAGDVTANHFGTAQTPLPGFEAIDLRSLSIEDHPDVVRFVLETSGLQEQGSAQVGSLFVRFRHGELWYSVHFAQSLEDGARFAFLRATTPDSPWGPTLRTLAPVADPATKTVWADVPRTLLVDAAGNPPARDRFLEDVHALSIWTFSLEFGDLSPARVGDAMPGDLAQAARFAFVHGGGNQSGPVELLVDRPFRTSNGEATTYPLRVTLRNDADAERVFALTTLGMPESWTLDAGGSLVRVGAHGAVEFRALLTVPFAHEHGSVVAFDLRAEATDDASVWAQQEVGVHYHTIAQPAGHHPRLHIHSNEWSTLAAALNPSLGGTGGVLYMNTLEEDAGDDQAPMRGRSRLVDTEQEYRWAACLQPELSMGIDFDLARQGLVHLQLRSTEPIEGTLSGRLLWIGPGQPWTWCSPYSYGGREQVELALIGPGAVALGAQGSGSVEAALVPTPAAERIEWEEGATLVFDFAITVARPAVGGSTGIDLMPGSFLDLPLDEFHELVAISPNATVENPEVFDDAQPAKESPLPLVAALVAVALAVARRR